MGDVFLEEKEFISIAIPTGPRVDHLKKEKDTFEEFDDLSTAASWSFVCWTCYDCNQTFSDVPSFSTHQQLMHQITHEEDIVYQCYECREPFGYASFLNHVRNVHYEALKLCCDVCNEALPDHKQLAVHRDKHIGRVNYVHPTVYHCNLCTEVRSTVNELKSHMQHSHNLQTTKNNQNKVLNFKEQKKGRKHQRATQQQLQFYIGFCKEHPELWTRKNISRAHSAIQQLWSELAEKLNSMRGPTRTPEKWKESFNQLKNQMHCRARKAGEHQRVTDQSSRSPDIKLSKIEQQEHIALRISAVHGKEDIAILGFQDVNDSLSEENSAAAGTNFHAAESDENLITTGNKKSTIVVESTPIQDCPSGTEVVLPNESNSRKRVTPQVIYEELKKSITKRNEIQERSLMLQERMLHQQQETNAALKRIEESILAVAEVFAMR